MKIRLAWGLKLKDNAFPGFTSPGKPPRFQGSRHATNVCSQGVGLGNILLTIPMLFSALSIALIEQKKGFKQTYPQRWWAIIFFPKS
jgi:hypothetical protein